MKTNRTNRRGLTFVEILIIIAIIALLAAIAVPNFLRARKRSAIIEQVEKNWGAVVKTEHTYDSGKERLVVEYKVKEDPTGQTIGKIVFEDGKPVTINGLAAVHITAPKSEDLPKQPPAKLPDGFVPNPLNLPPGK